VQKWRFIYKDSQSYFLDVFWEQHWAHFVLADDLHINIPKFVAGRGTVIQPVSVNIVFGGKQAQ